MGELCGVPPGPAPDLLFSGGLSIFVTGLTGNEASFVIIELYMKKLLKLILILLSVLCLTSSCKDVDNDKYYDADEELSMYLRDGRWYPFSKMGLTDCQFNSYMIFRGHYMYAYDCHDVNYDTGSFDVHNGYLNIHHENGDLMTYRVVAANNGELELRSVSDGTTYVYVRN